MLFCGPKGKVYRSLGVQAGCSTRKETATQCGPVSGSYQRNNSTSCHWTYDDLKDKVLANRHLMMKWIFDEGLIAGQRKCPTCSNDMVISECTDRSDGMRWECRTRETSAHFPSEKEVGFRKAIWPSKRSWSFGSIFAAIARAHKNITRTYSLDPRAFDVHKRLKTEHVHEVNRAIQNGEVPPKSKGTDMVARVAVCLSTLHYFIYNLLKSEPCSDPPENITHSCYEKAMAYVDFLHSQKEMFAEFIKCIVQPAKEQTRGQPTALDIKTAILRFPGRLVTFQSFKKYSPRNLRSVQRQEFEQHVDDLKDFGTAVQIRVPRQARKIVVLIKKPVAEILPWPEHSPCSKDEYAQKFSEPRNKLITANIVDTLIRDGHITRQDISLWTLQFFETRTFQAFQWWFINSGVCCLVL